MRVFRSQILITFFGDFCTEVKDKLIEINYWIQEQCIRSDLLWAPVSNVIMDGVIMELKLLNDVQSVQEHLTFALQQITNWAHGNP